MNDKIIKELLENRELFVPLIFTQKQFNTLKKRAENKKLSNSEKKSLYTTIKKKMECLNFINTRIYVSGIEHILPERLEAAQKIIHQNKGKYEKIFIAGSFLFSNEYNDIDVYIIAKKGYREEWKGNQHLIFVSENKLTKPIFQSAAMISVSNFLIPRSLLKKKPKLQEIMSTYHEAVIEFLNKEKKPEMIRNLIFYYNLFCLNTIINSEELQNEIKHITLQKINDVAKELLSYLFSKSYLYEGISWYVDMLENDIKAIEQNKNLIEYKKTYEELLYGRNKETIA